MHKFYIFDMDGTLCDSMHLWRSALSLCGGEMPAVLDYMRDKYAHEIQLKAGVLEFIARMQKSGIKTCIASATDKWISQPFLDRTGLMHAMEFYADCSSLGIHKSDPQFYIKTAQMLGADIAECAVFEDAPYCAESAKKAGFFTVGVHDRVTAKDGDLSQWCDVMVNSIGDFNETEIIAT